eukprot:jgi/Psemu1/11355/gm1.11355_g
MIVDQSQNDTLNSNRKNTIVLPSVETSDAAPRNEKSSTDMMEHSYIANYTPSERLQPYNNNEHDRMEASLLPCETCSSIDDDQLKLLRESQNEANVMSTMDIAQNHQGATPSQSNGYFGALRSKRFAMKSTAKKFMQKMKKTVVKTKAPSSRRPSFARKRSLSFDDVDAISADADPGSDTTSTSATDLISQIMEYRQSAELTQTQKNDHAERTASQGVRPSTKPKFPFSFARTEKRCFQKRRHSHSRVSDDGFNSQELAYADLRYRVERCFLEPFL